MRFLFTPALFLLLILVSVANAQAVASGSKYAVATVHPAATQAAEEVFKEGGNAIDAAVAAALTLSVVDNQNSGIGGGCLALVRKSSGELLAIDGREMAPAAAHRDMYLVDGKADPQLSQTGPLAVGVPGALAAYQELLNQAGTMPMARLLAPGEKLARHGSRINWEYAQRLQGVQSKVAKFPATKAVLFNSNGKPKQEGDLLVQADLAETHKAIAENGIDWFYRGPFAEKVGNWMQENGGILTASDFANYQVKMRQPIRTTYRGYQIVGFPPPSSGGIHVAQVLNLLEPYDLEKILKDDAVLGYHLIAEAMKIAFADRAHWLGDTDYVKVPRGLISKAYANKLREQLDPDAASKVASYSTPDNWSGDCFGQHTTHIATSDAEGNWVAITATVNTTFGSCVIVPGTGVVLNNEMDDFSIQPGTPNAFGLVGAENNAIEPGKRPLSSMSPTIILDPDGKPIMTVGAAGGPKIITQVILAIIRHLDQKMSIEQAVAAPRIHHQWRPARLGVEIAKSSAREDRHAVSIDGIIRQGLLERGHAIYRLPAAGVTQAIVVDGAGKLRAAHDPRVPGKAWAE